MNPECMLYLTDGQGIFPRLPKSLDSSDCGLTGALETLLLW